MMTETDDVAIEPEIELDPEPEIAIEPEAEPAIEPAAAVSLSLVEILPADFKLPLLTKFIPNPALKAKADEAATYALGLSVQGQGREGIERADLALTALRASVKAIQEHFEEPTAIANDLHKRLTSIRGEWQASAKTAVETVGRRVYDETARLNQIAAEERRKAQEAADRHAREAAQREADAAAKAQAPAAVVEELKQQAKTATAPPVMTPAAAAPVMRGSTTVTTWKARLIGTSGDLEPNPETKDLTPAQRLQVLELLKAIIEGRAPLAAVEVAWPYLNSRAKADKGALTIPGIEAFEQGSVRAKGVRGR